MNKTADHCFALRLDDLTRWKIEYWYKKANCASRNAFVEKAVIFYIYEMCAERDSLKGQVRDYERVRQAIGPEQADRILEATHQQEQAEKERKRVTRQKVKLGAR